MLLQFIERNAAESSSPNLLNKACCRLGNRILDVLMLRPQVDVKCFKCGYGLGGTLPCSRRRGELVRDKDRRSDEQNDWQEQDHEKEFLYRRYQYQVGHNQRLN